jgi:hypothetical protein
MMFRPSNAQRIDLTIQKNTSGSTHIYWYKAQMVSLRLTPVEEGKLKYTLHRDCAYRIHLPTERRKGVRKNVRERECKNAHPLSVAFLQCGIRLRGAHPLLSAELHRAELHSLV